MNLNTTFRASNLFGQAIISANAVAMSMKNQGAAPDSIKDAIFSDVLDSVSNNTVGHLFYAAGILIPTANLASLSDSANLLDGIVDALSKIVANDVIRFCAINTAVIKEATKAEGITEVRTDTKRKDATVTKMEPISDALRDELSGANVEAGADDNDCGDACKI